MACCCDSCHAPKSTTCCHGYIKPTKQNIYTLHPPVCRFHGSLPKVPMMHGATPTTVSAATTPATSVPFAATATANQVWPFQWLSFMCSDLEDRARAGSRAGSSAVPPGWAQAGARRGSVCVRPGVREGPLLPPAGWAQPRPERRDGRLAGARVLLQKHASPWRLKKWAVNLPCVQSCKSCSTSAFSLKQKYHPKHPSLWYFGMSSLGWKVEVETQSGLPSPQNWTPKTTKKSPNNQKLGVRL